MYICVVHIKRDSSAHQKRWNCGPFGTRYGYYYIFESGKRMVDLFQVQQRVEIGIGICDIGVDKVR